MLDLKCNMLSPMVYRPKTVTSETHSACPESFLSWQVYLPDVVWSAVGTVRVASPLIKLIVLLSPSLRMRSLS